MSSFEKTSGMPESEWLSLEVEAMEGVLNDDSLDLTSGQLTEIANEQVTARLWHHVISKYENLTRRYPDASIPYPKDDEDYYEYAAALAEIEKKLEGE